MVKYIFKNSTLMNDMKDSIKDLISSFEDTTLLENIAENFSKKKELENSQAVYQRILEIDPTNDHAKRKISHFSAMKDPASVRYEDLPPIPLIDDYDRLRSIEIDYLQYKGTFGRPTSGAVSEITKTIKKNKKKNRRIVFPRGFDPLNPGPKPDPERWLPKLERIKFSKLAKKKGYITRTQGGNAKNTETKNTFQKGPSTATIKSESFNSKSKK